MPLDASKLKVGDCLSRIQYMKVVRISGDSVTVRDPTGFEWSIGKEILEKQAFSSSQFTEAERVTRTELARVLEQVQGARKGTAGDKSQFQKKTT